jgi:hypothetical protein
MHCGGMPWMVLAAMASHGWLRTVSKRERLRVVNGGCRDKKTLGWCWRQVIEAGKHEGESNATIQRISKPPLVQLPCGGPMVDGFWCFFASLSRFNSDQQSP